MRCCQILWEQRGSNPRPSACKADALNQLSYAPDFLSLSAQKGTANISSIFSSANNFSKFGQFFFKT